MEHKINHKLCLFVLLLICLFVSMLCIQNIQFQKLLSKISYFEKIEKNIQSLKHEYIAYLSDTNWDFEKNISISLQKQNLDKKIQHFQIHNDVKNISMLEIHLEQIKFKDFQTWIQSLKDFPWVRLIKIDITPNNSADLNVIIELGLYQ